MKVSKIAENIIGSEIIKFASEIQEKIKSGEKVHNLTIGDFNPKIFPIPDLLNQLIIEEYKNNETNYPPADGIFELREAVSALLNRKLLLKYEPNEILIAAGARPIIYSIFKALVDTNDNVIFPTPSWNNNHYTYLNGANPIIIETTPDNMFMPWADEIAPHIQSAQLLCLCSPQNPTGTMFTKYGLEKICNLVLAENERRGKNEKPLYVMYDQIYWQLSGERHPIDPVNINPKMREYTIFVDGISKSLAATGIRVGWAMGPKFIIDKMKSILTHVGAWAPRAEQIATAKYLNGIDHYEMYVALQNIKIKKRFDGLYTGFNNLKNEGFPIDIIKPQGGIYVSVKFDLKDKIKKDGTTIKTTEEIRKFLLDEAKLGIIPFYAFGSSTESNWFRISVGTLEEEDISTIIQDLRIALSQLN
jgi:aspartate aminotransferase